MPGTEERVFLEALSTGNYVYLKDSAGLIHVTEYYTTGAIGEVKGQKIKNGETGSEIKVREYEYVTHTAGGLSIDRLSKEILYPIQGDANTKIETSYAYELHPSSIQVKQRTTTLPAVASGQNGSGSSATRVEVFDIFGNLTWLKDERGFINRFVYDITIAKVTQSIQDVDTTQTNDEPSGWSTPSGGGLHLASDLEYDGMGRLVQMLGPSHTADISGTATSVRTAEWAVYKEAAASDETWTGRGYATGSAGSYSYTLVNPVQIVKETGRETQTILAKRTTGSGKLDAGNTFSQSDWQRLSVDHYENKGKPEYTRVYHTIPATGEGSAGTNYDQSEVGYDGMGRIVRGKTPGGTITRQVFDARQQSASAWVGTDDTGATAADPDGSGGTNNMVKVSENEYDGGLAGGDGNLTKVTLQEDASNTRITLYGYDWRNRRVSEDGEVDHYQAMTYDNLNRLTQVDRRNTTSSGNLVARSVNYFDDWGRVYRSQTYSVDPAAGTVGNSLASDTWYDASGNPIKTVGAGAGKMFAKMTYDGVGRVTRQYSGYDVDETAYADASMVSGDTILEQVETAYDGAGCITLTTTRRRLHDATGEGELTTISGSQPKARVSYTASWCDGLGRSIATADYGTNGDSALVRPSAVPARSDTILIASTEYDDAGEAFKRIDPKALESRIVFDQAGRRSKTIEAYEDGDPATGNADRDRTTQYAYTADGKEKTITAKNSGTGDQITKYVYGTTLTDSGVATSHLHRATIYPDSDDTEALANGTDGTYDRVEHKYNRLGQPIERKDQNQTVHALEYDKLGRPTQDRITSFGTNVDQAVKRISRSYEVRGMLVSITSHDNAAVGSGAVLDEVKHAYNGFGQLVTEYQDHAAAVNTSTSLKMQYIYADGSSNQVRKSSGTYPNGRVISYDYGTSGGADDVLSRLSGIKQGANSIAGYTYLGMEQVIRKEYATPQVRLDHWGEVSGTYSGIDRFDRAAT